MGGVFLLMGPVAKNKKSSTNRILERLPYLIRHMTSVQNRGWLLYRGRNPTQSRVIMLGHYKIPLMNPQTYLLEWHNGASKVFGLRFRTPNFWKGQIWELDSHAFPFQTGRTLHE